MDKETTVKQNTIVVANTPNTNVIPYLFSLDRIEKPNCNLCQCDHRDFAEEIYDNQKKKNYSEIKRRLKAEHDFDATVNGIKIHMIYHYQAAKRNASLQEYADDVQKWVNMQSNKGAALKSRIAVLERMMFTIAQVSDEDVDISEKRKNAETVKKLAETILTHEAKLSELQEEAKPVNLIFNELQIIVNDELAHIDSPRTKQVVSTILSRLQESVGEMVIK